MPEEIEAEALGSLIAEETGGGAVVAGADALSGSTALAGDIAAETGGGAITASPNALMGASGAGGVGVAGADGFGGGTGSPTSFNQPVALGADEFAANAGAAVPALGVGAAPGTVSGGFSWPTLSQIGAGGNIFSALYGMDQASQLKKLAMMQANKSTPWATSGGGDMAAQQLMALISGKTDVSTLPGYAAGKQAVERSGAANGWLGSGNMMASLSKFGGDFYNNAVTQLAGLSGANFNPVSAGSLALNGANNSAALNLAAMSQINKTATTLGA